MQAWRKHPSGRGVTALAAVFALMLPACSTYDAVRIATSRDPGQTLSRLADARVRSWQTNPLRLVHDVERARRDMERLVAFLSGEVGRRWGRDEVLTPSETRYVKYTHNYLSRAIVQFDTGLITVETLDAANPTHSLRNAIVTTLLTPDDPRAVDLYSDRTIALSGRPYLQGLVEDQRGRAIGTPAQAEDYADHLLRSARQRRTIHTEQGVRTVHFVQLRMVNDHENRQARRYAPLVAQYAGRYGVSRSLVYAVIKTESNFNPFAVSSAPAYGLMQLVPHSGGRDAFQHVKGYDHIPSREYLFQPANNIELGTAYLSLLDREYLGAIADPVKREYCTIAAYNGGAGSVLDLFAGERERAVAVINRLPPHEVYRKLRDQHPRDETRRYLVKVLEARRRFVAS